MDVYLMIHETYNYDCGDYDIYETEIFKTLSDAQQYMLIKRDIIEQEYCDYEKVNSVQEIQDKYDEYSFDYEDSIIDIDEYRSYPYYFIYLEEFGHDRVSVQKKSIMSFNN